MKILLTLLLPLLFFGCSSEPESTEPPEVISMKIGCKYNSGAMYQENFYFNEDFTSARTTSDNKSTKEKIFSVEKTDDGFVLIGTKTKIDINKTETKYPNTKLYIMKEEASDYWNWGLYYYEDFKTDPFRFQVCHQFK